MPLRSHRTPCVYEIAVIFLVLGATVAIGGSVWLWHQASIAEGNQALVATSTRVRLVLPTSSGLQSAGLSPALPTLPRLPSPVTLVESPTLSPVLPTATATITPSSTPTLTPLPTTTTPTFLAPVATVAATLTPLAPISGAPSPAPEFVSSDDLLNILILGNDSRTGGRASLRTDVVVIVSVNKTTGTVNMLSLPRDLYVYVPAIGYNRINTVLYLGENEIGSGNGIRLLKDTIRYNLGIPIHAYALVNFSGFERIIDALDGVDIVVDCPLSDYRLKSPDLNPQLFANWEWITLDVGVHHLDGPAALWYARTRVTTSDFDRNRRHQLLLRAIWHRFNSANMWSSIPELWGVFRDTIQTDLSLNDILSLIPIGVQLDPSLIESHFIGLGQVEPFRTPSGGSVLRLKPGAASQVVTKFYTPPTLNQLFYENARIEIVNQTGLDQLDLVAQQRLVWEGFTPIIASNKDNDVASRTILYDYTGVTKGSSINTLQRILGISEPDVRYQPDPNRTVDYRIVLGQSYEPCTYKPWEIWGQVN